MAAITALDPRKTKIVTALKEKSGAVKVTQVKQLGPDLYSGHCFGRMPGSVKFTPLGIFSVTISID